MLVDDLFNKKTLTENRGGGSPWHSEPEQQQMDANRRGRLGRERNAGLDEPDDAPSGSAPTGNGVYEYTVPAGQESVAQELGLQQHRGHWVSRVPIQRANFQFGRPQFHEIPSQGVAEGMAQDEAEEEYGGWRAELVNQINYNTFEVKLTNSRARESANFIIRPVDMVSYGPTLSIETMDVRDLQTGRTESWTNDDPAPQGPIAYAISALFYDDKQLQKALQNIIDTHDTKGQDMLPGLEKRRSIGQEVGADAYVDSGKKTQDAMAKMKKGVAEGKKHRINEAMLMEDPIYRKFKVVGRYIAERRMSEKEILQVFADAETGMTDKGTGANRTMLGRGKDNTMAFAGSVKDAVTSVLSSIQNSVPVSAVDVAYDQATDALAGLSGGQRGKVMQAIKGYRNLVKEYPKTAGFAKAALVAIVGLATGGAGLPVIAGLTYALDSAIRGDKLSSVLGKGIGASAVTWGGQQVAGALSGGDAATPDSNSQGPNVDDRIDAARARVDAANSKLGIDGSAQNYDVTGNVSQAAGVDTPLPQGATVRCPLGSCNGDAWQVKPGETFNDIAQQIGVPPEELVKLNPGLGGPGGTYTVIKGDQLGFIAQAQGTTPEAIRAANPDIDFAKALKPGTELNLPAAGTPGQGSLWADYKGGMYGDKAPGAGGGGQTAGMSPEPLGGGAAVDAAVPTTPSGPLLSFPDGGNSGTLTLPDGREVQAYAFPSGGIQPRLGPGLETVPVNYAGQDVTAYIVNGKAYIKNFNPQEFSNPVQESWLPAVRLLKLPAEKLIDRQGTIMSWALQESIGVKRKSVNLTTTGAYTVFENIDRYRQAIMEKAGVPGSTRPAYYRPDMSGGPGKKSKPGIVGRGLNWLDRTVGKVGGALSNFGHQFTTNVTKEKLKMNWHQAGKPSDSDQLAAFLTKQGVPQEVVATVYGKMSIPYTAPVVEPKAQPATDPAVTAKSGIQTGATALIDPDTKRPYEKDKLAAMYGYKEPVAPTAGAAKTPAAPTTPATTATPTSNPAGFNAGNVMKLDGMEKYAKPAAPAKTANFGGPGGYGKITTSIKPPAAPRSSALAVPKAPEAPAAPNTASDQKLTPDQYIKRIAAPALPESVAETLAQVDRMLESVNSKKSADIIKAYVDQRFTELGLRNTTECRNLMAHVVQESAVRRRAYAQRMAK